MLGRYIMDHAGAPKDDDWYQGVFDRGVSAEVRDSVERLRHGPALPRDVAISFEHLALASSMRVC